MITTKNTCARMRLAVGLAAGVLLAVPGAQATDRYWDVNGTAAGFSTVVGAWNTGLLWNTNPAGGAGTVVANPAATDDCFISPATVNTGSITLTGAKSASSITFLANVGPTVNITGGGPITIGGTGAYQGIRQQSSGANTISTALTLKSDVTAFNIANSSSGLLTIGTGALNGSATGLQTVTVGAGSTGGITLSGIIGNGAGGGTVGLTVNSSGTGVTTLSGANTFSGGLNIQAGTVKLGAATGASTNAVTLGVVGDATSGTLDLGGGSRTISGLLSTLGTAASQTITSTTTGGVLNYTGPTTSFGGIITGSIASFTGVTLNNAATTLTLTGANTYGGTNTLTAGTLSISSDTAGNFNLGTASTPIKFNGGTLQITGTAITNFGSHTPTFTATKTVGLDIAAAGNTFTVSQALNQTSGGLTKSGAGTLVLSNAGNTYTGTTTVNGGTLACWTNNALGSGAVTVNGAGAVLSLGAYSNTVGGVTLTAGDITGSGKLICGSPGITVNNDAATSISVTLSTAYHLTKSGAGTLTISGANNYWNNTTVTGGTLAYGVNDALGIAVLTVNGAGAVLSMGSYNDTVGDVILTAGDITGSGTLTCGYITANNPLATSVSVNLAGIRTLTKSGAGTLTLTGANTYTGATYVNAGTLVADTAVNATVLSASSQLRMGGGTFQLKGLASTVRTQTVNGLYLDAGASVVEVNNPGTSTTLTLGAITRNAGSVDFRATGGTLNATTAIIGTTTANNSNGILGLWATANNGADLAANDGDNHIVAYTGGYADVTRLSSGAKTIASSPASQVRIIEGTGTAASITPNATGTTDINSLFQSISGGTSAATYDPDASDILRFGAAGGILMQPTAGALTLGATADDGQVTAGGTANTAGELILNNGSASTLTINSTVVNNGTGAVSLRSVGTGATVLSGANTYTGTTTLGAGTLTLSGANTCTNTTTLNGGTLVVANQYALQNSTVTFVVNNTATVVFDSSAGTNFTFGGLAPATFGGAWTPSGYIDLTNSAGAPVALTVGNNNADTTFSGIFTGAGSLIKVGTGTLTLGRRQGTSSWSGGLIIKNGVVRGASEGADSLGANGNPITLGDDGGDATLALSGIVGSMTYPQPITVAGGSGLRKIEFVSIPITLSTVVTLNKDVTIAVTGGTSIHKLPGGIAGTGSVTFTVNNSGATNGITVSGGITTVGFITNNGTNSGSLVISGAIGSGVTGVTQNSANSMMVLSTNNTYTGDTTVSAGMLSVTNSGTLGSGNVTVTAGTLLLNTGTAIGDTNRLTIADGGGAKVNVNGVTETVQELYFGTKQQASGTWGASGAAHIDTDHFAGTGTIIVLKGPKNGTLILLF